MDSGDVKICRKCRRINLRSAQYCSECLYPFLAHFDQTASRRPASVHSYVPLGSLPKVAPAAQDVTMAAQLSVVLPGAGQMYNAQLAKGVVLLILFLLTLALAVVIKLIAIIAGCLLWLVSIVDAAIVAGRIIEGEAMGPWRWY